LPNERLLCALFARASSTLYDDNNWDHVQTSRRFKLQNWFRVFRGHVFCKIHCPAVLDSASGQLLHDLDRIRQRGLNEGLSVGSGLETLDALRELDEMIDAAWEDGQFDGYPFGVPDDSLEAGAAHVTSTEVNASNAQLVQRARNIVFDRGDASATVQVVHLKFRRAPDAFRRALLEGAHLHDCRISLERCRLDAVVEGGAKVFVRPEHYTAVMAKIRQDGLSLVSSVVIVAEEFEGAVQQALASIPSSERVVGSGRTRVSASTARDWDEVTQLTGIRVERTFITVGVSGSLLSAPVQRGALST
jgi:hypothetical protein